MRPDPAPHPPAAVEHQRERTPRGFRASWAMVDAVVTNSDDVVMLLDADGTIRWVSEAARHLFGAEPSALVGRDALAMVHPDDRDRVRTDLLASLGPGDHVRTEYRVIGDGGEERWLEEMATNLLDEPSVRAIVGNLRDVTARKRTEEALDLQARLLAAAGQAIIAADPSGVVLYWNAAAAATFGWSAEEAVGRSLGEIMVPAGGWEGLGDEVRARLRGAEPWAGEFWVRGKDGRAVPVLVSDTPVFDDHGVHVANIGVSTDITERVELQRRVEEDRRRLADAQASAGLGSFEIDLATGHIERSDELHRILGHPVGALDDAAYDQVHPDDRELVEAAIRSAMADGADTESTHRIVRPSGEVRWVISRTRGFEASERRILSGTVYDITERRVAELALAHQVTHDPLTTLLNRTGLSELVSSRLEAATGPDDRVAVAFLDLDQFKVINDSLGHGVGDEALCAVAEVLRAGLRPTDVVGRFGGDEFVLVRSGLSTEDQARRLAEDAAAALRAPLVVGTRCFTMTVSIGVTLSEVGATATALLSDADAAMYQAKEDGRDRISVFDAASRSRAYRRLSVESALRDALERDELRLEYQPVLDLSTGRVAGFEALLRWTSPGLGAISPAEFIPLAEASGMVGAIGDWVLTEALTQLASWRRDPRVRGDVWMAVNLSAMQLGQPGHLERVAHALAVAGLPARLLHLEMTESVLVDRVEHAIATIGSLRRLGCRVSIDDFGTGYSSLSYLDRLPADTIKIDRSFVARLGTGGDTSIVRAIVVLAGTLGLDVVAEGIERPDQLAVVRTLGCAYGQGWLWSRSLAPDEALAWMLGADLRSSVVEPAT